MISRSMSKLHRSPNVSSAKEIGQWDLCGFVFINKIIPDYLQIASEWPRLTRLVIRKLSTEKETAMKLSGNTILITGGTSGIGFEMAKELLKKGNTVIVTGRDTAKLDRVKTQLPEIHVIQSDVSQAKEVQALRDKVTNEFPDLNVLVNNAGIWQTIDIQKENDLEDLTKEID